MTRESKFLLRSWLKMTAVALVAFAGGLGGIYFGQATLGQSGTIASGSGFGPSNPVMADQYVTFEPGDLFPPVQYIDMSGQPGNFGELIGENGSIVLFISFSCHACMEVLEFWQENLSARIKPDIKVIAAIDMASKSPDIPPEYIGLFDGMEIAWIHSEFWADNYNLTFWPTVIGVDGSGFVIHVQPGFGTYLDHELATYFLKANQ